MIVGDQTTKTRAGSRRWLAFAGVLSLVVASCGNGDGDTSSQTTVSPSEQTDEVIEGDNDNDAEGGTAESQDPDTAATEPEGDVEGGEVVTTEPPDGDEPGDSDADHEANIDVDPEWERREASWFVWNVESDDVLNVRAEPDANSAVLAVLAHNATGITLYSEEARNGDTPWGVVELDGRTGWVALDYLRPEPTASEQIGSPELDTLPETLEGIVEGLRDRSALVNFIGDGGLLLSPDGFVSADDVVLGAGDVATSGATQVWGVEAGSGDTIEMTVDDYFEWLRGSTALTSTEVTSYDGVVGSGTTINNIAEYFPGSSTVELHHRGTPYYGGLDWQSVRFVFDLTGDSPVLLAIVSDAWTP